jgi:ribonuclease P protein component
LNNEKDISTEEYQESSGSRFPQANEHPVRKIGHKQKAQTGPEATRRLACKFPGVSGRPMFPVNRPMALKVLRKNWQFRLVYRQGEKIVCENTVVFIHRPDSNQGMPAFGFVASRRIGNAVRRNRAKRLLREAARKISSDMTGMDIWVVLVAKAGILEASFSDITSELQNIFINFRYLKQNYHNNGTAY